MVIPLIDLWGTISQYKGLCKVMEKDGKSMEDFLFVAGIMIPCIIIGVLYACIYYNVRKQLKKISAQISNSSAHQRERHLTLMTLLIFISFLLCCLPSVIEHFWFLESSSLWPNVIGASFCGVLSTINPFIYAATNRKYRTAYFKLFSDMKFWNFDDRNGSYATTSASD